MNYKILNSFLADLDPSQIPTLLIGGQWIEICEWRDTHAEYGLLLCKSARLQNITYCKQKRDQEWTTSLIVLAEIQAVRIETA